jgi:hypothetical protein
MATFEVNEYDIDINNKSLISFASGGGLLDDQDKPRLYFSESVVWALNCYTRNQTAAAFAESDTWELWADVDFDHDLYEGTLGGALVTSSPTTSIIIDYTVAPTANTIGDTGALLLRDDNGNRERVAYTAVTGEATTQATYTINSITLANPYESGDYAANEDPLMVGTADAGFNVSGDWSGLDVTGGKISAKLDMTSWEFQKKVTAYAASNPSANEVPIWVQINKYASGQSTPSVILQDQIYAKPSVRDIESASAVSVQNWTLADARYLPVFSLQSATTEALVSADSISVFRAATSGVNKFTLDQLQDYLNRTTSDSTTSYTLVLADDGNDLYRSNAGANDTIIPLNSVVALAVDAKVEVVNEGAGVSTLKAITTGATLNGTAGGSGTIAQYGRVVLTQRSIDAWVATGDLVTT